MSLFGSRNVSGRIQVVVVANGCKDATAEIALGFKSTAEDKEWEMTVLDLESGGKSLALNEGDRVALWENRLYMDADIVVDPYLLEQIQYALGAPRPVYVSGRLVVAPAKSIVTRKYARFWSELPFLQRGVAGAGLFAVNALGRMRWSFFPEIISDDTFVRLHFSPKERVGVKASYQWPMAEGWNNLVRVRRRQDRGVAEVAQKWPDLLENDDKAFFGALNLLRLACKDPIGLSIYTFVTLAVRLTHDYRGVAPWERGR